MHSRHFVLGGHAENPALLVCGVVFASRRTSGRFGCRWWSGTFQSINHLKKIWPCLWHRSKCQMSISMETDRVDPVQRILTEARPRLWKAFVAVRGDDGADDAVSEALAWGWEHRERLVAMDNPIGYLYRVGLSRSAKNVATSRSATYEMLPEPAEIGLPLIEPGLIPALLSLPERQRYAVWLVHGCGWTHAETADALDIARSTVGTHISRAMTNLRQKLEVKVNG